MFTSIDKSLIRFSAECSCVDMLEGDMECILWLWCGCLFSVGWHVDVRSGR